MNVILGRHLDLDSPSSHPIFHSLTGYGHRGKQCRQLEQCTQWKSWHRHHTRFKWSYFRLVLGWSLLGNGTLSPNISELFTRYATKNLKNILQDIQLKSDEWVNFKWVLDHESEKHGYSSLATGYKLPCAFPRQSYLAVNTEKQSTRSFLSLTPHYCLSASHYIKLTEHFL